MSVTNPVPVLLNVVVSPRVGGFLFEYDKPTDLDFAGVRIYASTSSGFTPSASNLLVDSAESSVFVTGLVEGVTYYYVYIPYDLFGDGVASTEASVTTIIAVVSGTIEDPASSDRQLAPDEYIVYADVISSLRTGKYALSGSASLTVTNPQSWSEITYQQCMVATFAYQTKALIPVDVDLSSGAFMRSWGIGQRIDGDGDDIAQYFSLNDYITFGADNGVENKLYKIREIEDSTTAYVELIQPAVNTSPYTVQGDLNSVQCRVYTSPTALQFSVFSRTKWTKEYVANAGEDFDLVGGWVIPEIEIDESAAVNVLMMLLAPSMGCIPGVSTQGIDKASIHWQAQYKGQ